MLVKISKFDGGEIVTSFPIGLHTLGRGSDLQCNDKRVSRNHASIEVTPDTVQLTSTHINPCFLRAANSKTLTILKKDSTTTLNDGDAFSLLPEGFWFKVQVIPGEDTKEETLKRLLNSCEDAPPDKKAKMETVDEDKSIASNGDALMEEANKTDLEGESSVKVQEANVTVTESKDEPEEEKAGEEVSVPAEVKEMSNLEIAEATNEPPEPEDKGAEAEPAEQATDQDPEGATASNDDPTPAADASASQDANPGPANPRPKKEKCWYGAQCYRKNPVHRQDYTHPGDSDYDSDPNDNRPACPYGAQCYRKNKLHRRDYQHPSRQPGQSKDANKCPYCVHCNTRFNRKDGYESEKRNRKKVDRLNVADSEEMRALDDSEDPFIDDDDSDEYVEDSYDEDSDWEESQDMDEDQDNVKRLVKEANRFVKK